MRSSSLLAEWDSGDVLDLPVEPMLAAPSRLVPEPGALRGGAVYQPKYDGFRALVFVGVDGVRVQSRGGHDITTSFADVAAAVATQLPPGVVLDGELVIWGEGRLDFPALQTRLASKRKAPALALDRPASFMVFDVLEVADTSVMGLAMKDRRMLLEEVLKDAVPPVHLVPSTTDVAVAREWLADYASALGLGVEGLVIKAGADAYLPGKRGWFKYRLRETHDVVVGAVLGSVAQPARLVLGYYPTASSHEGSGSGRLRVAGATMSFADKGMGRMVGGLLEAAGDEHPWPTRMPSGWLGQWGGPGHTVHRVSPLLVVEVSADTAFEHGRWRHLVRFVRTRQDLDPQTIGPPAP